MTVKDFRIDVQPLYDLIVLGKSIHRPDLDERCFAMLRARHYTQLENITLRYTDENGKEIAVKANEHSDTVIKMKILVLFVQSDRYDYSKENREVLKRKLEINQISCSNYMPEIINERREWRYDNLEDAVNAFVRQ